MNNNGHGRWAILLVLILASCGAPTENVTKAPEPTSQTRAATTPTLTPNLEPPTPENDIEASLSINLEIEEAAGWLVNSYVIQMDDEDIVIEGASWADDNEIIFHVDFSDGSGVISIDPEQITSGLMVVTLDDQSELGDDISEIYPGEELRVSPNERYEYVDDEKGVGSDLMYAVKDFENQKTIPLGSLTEFNFDFLEWSPDSQYFELIRMPFSASKDNGILVPVFESRIEYGMLKYYPETKSFFFVLRHAVYVISQVEYMFAVTYINEFENTGMRMAIYTREGDPVTEVLPFSSTFLLPDNERGDPDAWAWSNAGEQVVYADEQGNIWLFGIDGQKINLAADLEIKDWPYYPNFTWSPDDRWILVEYESRRWMLIWTE